MQKGQVRENAWVDYWLGHQRKMFKEVVIGPGSKWYEEAQMPSCSGGRSSQQGKKSKCKGPDVKWAGNVPRVGRRSRDECVAREMRSKRSRGQNPGLTMKGTLQSSTKTVNCYRFLGTEWSFHLHVLPTLYVQIEFLTCLLPLKSWKM